MTALRTARSMQRAMTLVEAVVATALLAIVAAATLPILTGAARAARASTTGETARHGADETGQLHRKRSRDASVRAWPARGSQTRGFIPWWKSRCACTCCCA